MLELHLSVVEVVVALNDLVSHLALVLAEVLSLSIVGDGGPHVGRVSVAVGEVVFTDVVVDREESGGVWLLQFDGEVEVGDALVGEAVDLQLSEAELSDECRFGVVSHVAGDL